MTHQLARWIGLIGSCGLMIAAGARWTPCSTPEVEHALEHWFRARELVSTFQTRDPGASTAAVSGVQVVLRHRGRPVGSAWALDTTADDPLRKAVSQAMSRALADPALSALTPELQRAAFVHITVEVETAGVLTPLSAGSLETAAADLHPGRDGLALRVGDQWDARFPSALRSSGAAATIDELRGMALVAGMTPAELDDARRAGRASIYRFNTIDLDQCGTRDGPDVVTRGGAEPPRQPDRASLKHAAALVTTHILDHCWRPTPDGPLRAGGTYLPHADHTEPIVASDADHLVLAAALARIARSGVLDDMLADRALRTAGELATVEAGTSPSIQALRAVAHAEGVPGVTVDEHVTLAVLQDEGAPIAARAMCAWCRPTSPQADVFLNSLSEAHAGELLDALPWIALADERRINAGSPPLLWSRLEHLRRSLDARRVSIPGDAAHGGYAFDDSLASVNAVSMRPATWLAASDLYTQSWLLGTIVHEDDAACMRSGQRALGGVRFAPWDERQVPWVQALMLVALDRALKSHP